MLTVKTTVKNNKSKKLSLFAAQEIKKGEVIWGLNEPFDKFVSKDKLKNLSELQQEHIKENYPLFENKYYFIAGDNARFMSEHTKGNVQESPTNVDEIIALQDIEEGEEIILQVEGESEDSQEDENVSLSE